MLEQTGQPSDLVEVAKRNGDFKRNYGTIIGAFLYLRSLSAARGRSSYWLGLIVSLFFAGLTWATRVGWW